MATQLPNDMNELTNWVHDTLISIANGRADYACDKHAAICFMLTHYKTLMLGYTTYAQLGLCISWLLDSGKLRYVENTTSVFTVVCDPVEIVKSKLK